MSESAGERLLELHGLRIGHRGIALGEPIDLRMNAGEVLCVLGPNGSGKTSLFRTLLGLLPALGGSVSMAGQSLAKLSRSELARLVAYVPQAHQGVFAYRVDEVVLMGRCVHLGMAALPSHVDRAITLETLKCLGVAHLRHKPYTEISGGERQLVLIARALAQEARLLVMDEPTASLDFGNQRRVLDVISGLRDRGMAILMSTHQPEHALCIADRVVLMRKGGRLLASGTPARVMSAEALAELYGLDPQEVRRSFELPARFWSGGRMQEGADVAR